MPIQQIRPAQLKEWLADAGRTPPLLLDVREEWEYRLCSLPGSVHIPMGAVPARAAELVPDKEVVVVCHHGGRSQQVANWLQRNGFDKLHNLAGGVDAWAREVEPSMPVY
jgi:rhodanese-related sulfurtransferase